MKRFILNLPKNVFLLAVGLAGAYFILSSIRIFMALYFMPFDCDASIDGRMVWGILLLYAVLYVLFFICLKKKFYVRLFFISIFILFIFNQMIMDVSLKSCFSSFLR